MQFMQFTAARADTGAVLPYAKVTVYQTGTATKAALFDSSGVALPNPVTASSVGLVGIAAANGVYDLQINSADGSFTNPLMTGVQIYDLAALFGLAAISNPTDSASTTSAVISILAALRGNGASAAPVISLATASISNSEGASGATSFDYTVTRSGVLTSASSASWAVTGSGSNPAVAADFVGGALPSGTVNFAAGASTATISVQVAGDATVEPDEAFTLTLSSPVNATLGSSTATGSIVNDDSAAVATLPRLSAAINAAKAGTGRAVWAMIGDSVTYGWGSNLAAGNGLGGNGAVSLQADSRRTKAWPQQMEAKWIAAGVPCRSDAIWGFHAASPDGGSTADFSIYVPNISFSGTTITTIPAVGGDYAGFTSVGHSITFTPLKAANRFDLYYTVLNNSGTFTVSDASGTLATINTVGGTTAMGKTTVTRATSSTSPITITLSSGGTSYLGAIVPYDTTAPCLEIWNMGHIGWKASNWIVSVNAYDPLPFLQYIASQVHLFSIELGANDAHASVSASTYQANLQSLITGIASASTRDLLLTKPQPAYSGGADTAYTVPAGYLTAIDALATSNSLRPAIDFNSAAYVVTDYYDSIHLTQAGYAKQATIAFNSVSSQV